MKLSKILFIKKYWGLLVLLIVIAIVGWQNLEPQFSVVGWDNFSVNLNLLINFPRTFFASWREYRGLGVPSDSEAVDIFRQGLFWLVSFVVPSELLTNLYYLILYGVGLVSCYFLIKFFLKTVIHRVPEFGLEVSSVVATFFYGFNLHTFETFFLPITMYAARFAFYPLFLVVFLKLLKLPHRKLSHWLAFVAVTWLVATTYLTATLFFTLVLILAFVAISYPSKLKIYGLLLGTFISLNAFWLFPFANYYSHKADLIPLASSFISVNESLLNKPASIFSWQKIITFYPEILSPQSLPFTDLKTGEPVAVDPLVGVDESQDHRMELLLVMPVLLAVLGIVTLAIMLILKKSVRGLWVILLSVSMLFLLRKEYPPFGWLYDSLGQAVPLFDIVFRFGGAKFSPLLLLSLVLALAYLISKYISLLFAFLPKWTSYLLAWLSFSVVIMVIILPFRGFFEGKLFSQLVLVKIPSAYQRLATVINQDPEYVRVVHLPFDEFSYWKSYSWGYMGSSFFSFMLDKPLLDRTFEPASLENDYFSLTLQKLIRGSSIASFDQLDSKVEQTYTLLRNTGVKYLVFDQSVGQAIPTRGLRAWGVFHEADTRRLVASLEEKGLIKLRQEEEIDLVSIAQEYGTDTEYIRGVQNPDLLLYEVQDSMSMVETIETATNVDPLIENTFIPPLLRPNLHFIQSKSYPEVTYPFWQPNRTITLTGEGLQFQQVIVGAENKTLTPNVLTENGKSVVRLEAAQIDEEIRLRIIPVSLTGDSATSSAEVILPTSLIPSDAGSFSSDVDRLSNWHVLPYAKHDKVRLEVAGQILPLPHQLSSDFQEVATFLATSDTIPISLLAEELNPQAVVPSTFQLTDDPNCFGDKQSGYDYFFNNSRLISLETQNGMTCLSAPLVIRSESDDTNSGLVDPNQPRLFELQFDYETTALFNPENGQHKLQTPSSLQQAIRSEIDALPTLESFSVCLLDQTNTCLNTRQWLRGNSLTSVVVPAERLTPAASTQLLITLPANQGEKNTLSLSNVSVRSFVPIWQETLEIPKAVGLNNDSFEVKNGQLVFDIPYVLSSASYYFYPHLDTFNSYSGMCQSTTGYRRLVTTDNWPVISYLENCYQGLSATLPYDPQSFYLWLTQYFVFMGKQPRFIARQETELTNEYLSRFDGYPNLPGFKSLQIADPLLGKNADQNIIKSALIEAESRTSFTSLSPGASGSDAKVSWEISQQGEGQSLIGLQSMNLVELPSSWSNLAFDETGSQLQFSPAEITQVNRIWPSLWKISLTFDEAHSGPVLLKFGQAYDQQWQIYQTDNLWKAVVGQGRLGAEQVKVDGWSNGWILQPQNNNQQEMTIYVFYTPERVALIGWGISIGTVLCVCIVTLRRKRKGSLVPPKAEKPVVDELS